VSASERPDPSQLDPVLLGAQRAKGKRPQFLQDPAAERLLAITMALAGELSVTRERLDTLERLLQAQGMLAPEAIDQFAPDAAAQAARHEAGRAYIARVLRIVQQDVQALADAEEKPLEQWAAELGGSGSSEEAQP
jgi:hypothetical protein